MPCLNEEKSLAGCIDKALSCFARLGIAGEVVVADNGSSDRSVEIARACGARVVHVAPRGYGAALSAGIVAAQGRIIVIGDSDDSYDWSRLDSFVDAIRAGNDLVIGNRFLGGIDDGAMPPLHRYFGNPLLSWLSRRLFRIPIGDFHCGMRAFTRDAFTHMGTTSDGMEFATEMVANAAQAGLRIAEIPTHLYPDKRGRPPHLRSFRDGWRHLRFMLSHAPDHTFMLPGAVLMVCGSLLMAMLVRGPIRVHGVYLGVHFMVLGSLLTLSGMHLMSMWILARVILLPGDRRSSWLPRVLHHPNVMEIMLATGAALLTAGFGIDAALFVDWLGSSKGMEQSVHLSIVASTVMLIGLQTMFLAFLFFLAESRQSARRSSLPPRA